CSSTGAGGSSYYRNRVRGSMAGDVNEVDDESDVHEAAIVTIIIRYCRRLRRFIVHHYRL
ncbi:hypothetical protein TorRG33x02_332910, partial [Trema orientale]